MRLVEAVVVVAVIAGCHHEQVRTSPMLARMQRTECLGECPTYEVTLYRDGTVEYVGGRHVAATGRRIGHVDAETVAVVERALVDFAFATRPNYPKADCTDQPGVLLTYQNRILRHSHGDLSAPLELYALENITFDQLLRTARWVGSSGHVFVPWCKIDVDATRGDSQPGSAAR